MHRRLNAPTRASNSRAVAAQSLAVVCERETVEGDTGGGGTLPLSSGLRVLGDGCQSVAGLPTMLGFGAGCACTGGGLGHGLSNPHPDRALISSFGVLEVCAGV